MDPGWCLTVNFWGFRSTNGVGVGVGVGVGDGRGYVHRSNI